MTARELYDYILIELNKIEAPSLLLADYNYFINKAVQQYINLIYAKFEVDQQSTDDLRVFKASSILIPTKLTTDPTVGDIVAGGLFNTTYYVDLPADYLHLINCIIEYTVNATNSKCYEKNDKVYFAARRLTSDMYSQILNNAYLKPMYKRPYYYINNINPNIGSYTAYPGLKPVSNPNMDEAIINYNNGSTTSKDSVGIKGANYSEAVNQYAPSNLVDAYNSIGDRLANPSTVRLELRFGDDTVFTPSKVYVDYLKAPMYIKLTQDQINSTLDYSQLLEFPDYVCFEIVNIFTRLVMENASDPRLQTNMPINNTIINPMLQQS